MFITLRQIFSSNFWAGYFKSQITFSHLKKIHKWCHTNRGKGVTNFVTPKYKAQGTRGRQRGGGYKSLNFSGIIYEWSLRPISNCFEKMWVFLMDVSILNILILNFMCKNMTMQMGAVQMHNFKNLLLVNTLQ